MYYYLSTSHNPYYNLATEEHFLSTLNDDIIYLYRNAPSIIIGRNQNVHAEINEDYVNQHQIPVIRRLSGGGAVFHDLGNLNFCFISKREENQATKSFQDFTKPILDALHAMNILAEFSGRNDLLLQGKKISGNAQYHTNTKILHHGTLLFSADMNDLSAALKVKPGKIKAHQVDSYRSRVTNISSHLTSPMTIESFIEQITNQLLKNHDADTYPFSPEDDQHIRHLVTSKYKNHDYVYGQSKEYSYEHSIQYFGGTIEVQMNINQDTIMDLHFNGDFFGRRDIEEFVELVKKCPHKKTHFSDLFTKVDLDAYFMGITAEELLSLFF